MPQNTRKNTKKDKEVKPKKASKGKLYSQQLQSFFEKYAKALTAVVVVIILVVGGYYGYKYLYQQPREEKAATQLAHAQQWFAVDSFDFVINGNGLNPGALSVIKSYSGTKSANLAHYYLGISYLQTGDFQNAIKHLSKFDGKGTVVGYLADGALGDAYMEVKNVDKAIQSYKKAASDKDNKFITPLYLFRAGLACEKKGKDKEALKLYQQIKENFPYSQQGQVINKYLARLGDVSLD